MSTQFLKHVTAANRQYWETVTEKEKKYWERLLIKKRGRGMFPLERNATLKQKKKVSLTESFERNKGTEIIVKYIVILLKKLKP